MTRLFGTPLASSASPSASRCSRSSLWRIDLEQAGRALRDANYVYVIPGLALFGVAKLLVAQRWRVMMSKFADLPLPPLFGILLVSNLANNVVPARIGDLIRVQVPAQRYDISRARLAATVFATESLLDGIAFAVLGLIGLALIDLPNFPTASSGACSGGVAGGLIAVIPLSHLKLEDGWTAARHHADAAGPPRGSRSRRQCRTSSTASPSSATRASARRRSRSRSRSG